MEGVHKGKYMSLYTQEVVCSITLEATNKMHDIISLTEYWMGFYNHFKMG